MRPLRRAVLALAVLGLAGACGRLPETEIPTGLPNPPAPSIPPVPPPTPVPSATPTAQPSTSPTPAPSPTPGSSSCRLSAMPECGGPEGPPGVYGCCREEGVQVFRDQVDAAITQIQRDRPTLFDGERVRDADAYVQGVAQILEQRFGLCSRQGGPEDEVGVKNSNSFSEQYDILYGNGTIRRDGYTVTCRPARF